MYDGMKGGEKGGILVMSRRVLVLCRAEGTREVTVIVVVVNFVQISEHLRFRHSLARYHYSLP